MKHSVSDKYEWYLVNAPTYHVMQNYKLQRNLISVNFKIGV